MNAADYGWLVLLTPLLGLGFNIAVGASVSRRVVAWAASLSILAGFVLLAARLLRSALARRLPARDRVDRLALAVGGQLPRRREHPRRPALGRDAARHHGHRVPDPRLLGRLHGGRSGRESLLRVPQPVRVLDAAARARRELRDPARRLGPRRPLVVPADRLLVATPDRSGGGQEGLHHERDRRRRHDARHLRDLEPPAHGGLCAGVRPRRRAASAPAPRRPTGSRCCCSSAPSPSRRSSRCTPGCRTRWRAPRRSPP